MREKILTSGKERFWEDIRQPDQTPQTLLTEPNGWISWTLKFACSGVCIQSSFSVFSLHWAIFCHVHFCFLLHNFYPTAWGAPECILSLFEVLYSIVNLRLSDPLTMVLHFYPYPTSLTFDPVHENPAPSRSSSKSIAKFSSHLWKSSVSWLWISFYRPWSSLYL